MKVLYNASTLAVGGAVQLGTSLVMEALRNPLGIDWHFALSREVDAQLRRVHPEPIAQSEVIRATPAKSSSSRQRLAALEAEIGPDCVFTPYGPAYVQFSSPHLMGAANPWIAHADFHAYRVLRSPLAPLRNFALSIYRGYWFRKAEMLTVETDYVREGYFRRIGMPLSRIAVVANTCALQYLERRGERPFPLPGRRVRILCFAAPHEHKRIDMIPHVAAALARRRPDLDFEFVTTLPADEPMLKNILDVARLLGIEARINNLGSVAFADGPELYESCDICFLPTVLECFSATFPEAMAMGLPIVTTEMGFLRDVCKSAALYFPPNDASGAADRILELLASAPLWQRLLQAGKNVLKDLPTLTEKYRRYVELLVQLREEYAAIPAHAAVSTWRA